MQLTNYIFPSIKDILLAKALIGSSLTLTSLIFQLIIKLAVKNSLLVF